MTGKALELSGKNSVFSKKSAQNVGNAAPYIPKSELLKFLVSTPLTPILEPNTSSLIYL